MPSSRRLRTLRLVKYLISDNILNMIRTLIIKSIVLRKILFWINFNIQQTEQLSLNMTNITYNTAENDRYVLAYPDPQNAINIFGGEWSSRFPEGLAVEAGNLPLFEDPRVHALASKYQKLNNWKVLELGPLEGAHTTMFHDYGCHITSIEANERSYLKCLITKEILGLHRAHFLLGDFHKFLADTTLSYDLVFACGVLYHSTDPLGLLENASRSGSRIAIWTHYYSPEIIAHRADLDRLYSEISDFVIWKGEQIELRKRFYREAVHWNGFCGGPEPWAYWLTRNGLFQALRILGFTNVSILSEDLHHQNGPCIYVVADHVPFDT